MTAINSLSMAKQNVVAFKANDKSKSTESTECNKSKPKRHPLPAVASYFMPGSGQLMKGDNKRGFAHLGILAGLAVAGHAISKPIKQNAFKNALKGEKMLKGVSKSRKIGIFAIPIAFLANTLSSVVNAYKPKSEQG